MMHVYINYVLINEQGVNSIYIWHELRRSQSGFILLIKNSFDEHEH
jgi:hypothetical protein